MTSKETTPILSDKVFNVLKWITMFFLPAFIILVKGVGAEVGYEHTTMVANILTYFNAFFGALLGISTIQYQNNNK